MAYIDNRLWPTWYHPRKRLPASDLISRVARRFGTDRVQVCGPRRHRSLMGPRTIVARILRDRGLSYPAIGRLLGNRDHSTIMHCIDRFDVFERLDPRITEVYSEFKDA